MSPHRPELGRSPYRRIGVGLYHNHSSLLSFSTWLRIWFSLSREWQKTYGCWRIVSEDTLKKPLSDLLCFYITQTTAKVRLKLILIKVLSLINLLKVFPADCLHWLHFYLAYLCTDFTIVAPDTQIFQHIVGLQKHTTPRAKIHLRTVIVTAAVYSGLHL